MRRSNVGIIVEIFLISLLVLILLLPACRKERPPLDRNRSPETFITASPPETLDTDYRVHLYWSGTDDDGIVKRYIYYISDTVMTLDPVHEPEFEILDWNPAERIADYLLGRFTTTTDSIFIFKGYDDNTGALVNRQAFHIAAVDDGGKIDPTPARLQFNARVKGVPESIFWTIIYGNTKLFNPDAFDTISMFTPFSVRFIATTVNNIVTGYRWSYEEKIYPDYNDDGIPDWYIPTVDPPETVTVDLPNTGDEALASGAFIFKVIARDEAGAKSVSDVFTNVGVCKVVINHDPDTRVVKGQCFYTMQDSTAIEQTVNFSDGSPDTLPYHSRLRVDYFGWDDPKDLNSLEYLPPLPIRFQFKFFRSSTDGSNAKITPWYPMAMAEDTNPFADLDDPFRDADSTTMRVGSFDYKFMVRSFDEQYREDGTPDTVYFVGNFPPTLDSVLIGYDIDTGDDIVFQKTSTDTLFLKWTGIPGGPPGEPLNPYTFSFNPGMNTVSKYYRFLLKANGHDDEREPPGSGIKGWIFNIDDPDENYRYRREGEWIFPPPEETNQLLHELIIKFTVPAEQAATDSIVKDPPAFLGQQWIEIIGTDISDNEIFYEGIRAIAPQFDENGNVIPANNWITSAYNLANVARRDTIQGRFHLKLVF